MSKRKVRLLSPETASQVVALAWADRISFEEIKRQTGCTEGEVIAVMRRELKASSFRRWRERVSGRVTKHRKRARTAFQVPVRERMRTARPT